MKQIHTLSRTVTYAEIKGLGIIKIATEQQRMTLNESINAKSHQAGLPTNHYQYRYEIRGNYGTKIYTPIYLRCFISLIHIRRPELKSAPNFGQYLAPNCF